MELCSWEPFFGIFFETTGKNPFDLFVANISNAAIHQIAAHFRVW